MIKTQELRIGNWVMSNRPIQIKELTNNLPELLYLPIPLTPRILENSGFENVNADYKKDNFKIFSGHHEWMFLYTAIHCKEDELIFKYVHELQNLYFALYQKELEIKLLLKNPVLKS